jgi:hypothetical protein
MTTRTDRAERDAQAHEPMTRWTQLDTELRMICRSLANPKGWAPEAVTTFVRLPGDAEYRQAIGTLCRRLGLEFRLDQTVQRQGDEWCVRFARPMVAGKAKAAQGASGAALVRGSLRVAIARAYAAARRLPGLGAGQQVDAM